MDEILKQICELVHECGLFIKNADRSHIRIDEKSGRANFVTEYDRKVQDMLMEGLQKIVPDAVFYGEEENPNLGDTSEINTRGKYFIVDPIDGTTNFIKDYHGSSISVGLVEDGVAQLGVVYNPYLDEMFHAVRDKGAFCNGQPIHVSEEPLSNGLVLFGASPYNEELSEKSFKMAYEYFRQALDIRRSGSAALDLCSIAAGRAELYFELILSPWDHAAGGLIVEEAGGVVTDIDGNRVVYDKKCSVLACNKEVNSFLKNSN